MSLRLPLSDRGRDLAPLAPRPSPLAPTRDGQDSADAKQLDRAVAHYTQLQVACARRTLMAAGPTWLGQMVGPRSNRFARPSRPPPGLCLQDEMRSHAADRAVESVLPDEVRALFM